MQPFDFLGNIQNGLQQYFAPERTQANNVLSQFFPTKSYNFGMTTGANPPDLRIPPPQPQQPLLASSQSPQQPQMPQMSSMPSMPSQLDPNTLVSLLIALLGGQSQQPQMPPQSSLPVMQ